METRTPIAEILVSKDFQTLTQKQQTFCALLISLGQATGNYDVEKAASIAYGTKNGQILGAELMRQSKIRRVLDLHFGVSPKDAMLADLHRAIKRSMRKGKTIDEHLSKAIDFFNQHSEQKIEAE